MNFFHTNKYYVHGQIYECDANGYYMKCAYLTEINKISTAVLHLNFNTDSIFSYRKFKIYSFQLLFQHFHCFFFVWMKILINKNRPFHKSADEIFLTNWIKIAFWPLLVYFADQSKFGRQNVFRIRAVVDPHLFFKFEFVQFRQIVCGFCHD